MFSASSSVAYIGCSLFVLHVNALPLSTEDSSPHQATLLRRTLARRADSNVSLIASFSVIWGLILVCGLSFLGWRYWRHDRTNRQSREKPLEPSTNDENNQNPTPSSQQISQQNSGRTSRNRSHEQFVRDETSRHQALHQSHNQPQSAAQYPIQEEPQYQPQNATQTQAQYPSQYAPQGQSQYPTQYAPQGQSRYNSQYPSQDLSQRSYMTPAHVPAQDAITQSAPIEEEEEQYGNGPTNLRRKVTDIESQTQQLFSHKRSKQAAGGSRAMIASRGPRPGVSELDARPPQQQWRPPSASSFRRQRERTMEVLRRIYRDNEEPRPGSRASSAVAVVNMETNGTTEGADGEMSRYLDSRIPGSDMTHPRPFTQVPRMPPAAHHAETSQRRDDSLRDMLNDMEASYPDEPPMDLPSTFSPSKATFVSDDDDSSDVSSAVPPPSTARTQQQPNLSTLRNMQSIPPLSIPAVAPYQQKPDQVQTLAPVPETSKPLRSSQHSFQSPHQLVSPQSFQSPQSFHAPSAILPPEQLWTPSSQAHDRSAANEGTWASTRSPIYGTTAQGLSTHTVAEIAEEDEEDEQPLQAHDQQSEDRKRRQREIEQSSIPATTDVVTQRPNSYTANDDSNINVNAADTAHPNRSNSFVIEVVEEEDHNGRVSARRSQIRRASEHLEPATMDGLIRSATLSRSSTWQSERPSSATGSARGSTRGSTRPRIADVSGARVGAGAGTGSSSASTTRTLSSDPAASSNSLPAGGAIATAVAVPVTTAHAAGGVTSATGGVELE